MFFFFVCRTHYPSDKCVCSCKWSLAIGQAQRWAVSAWFAWLLCQQFCFFFSRSCPIESIKNGQFHRANMFCTFFFCSSNGENFRCSGCYWLRIYRIFEFHVTDILNIESVETFQAFPKLEWIWIAKKKHKHTASHTHTRQPNNVQNHCTQRDRVAGIYTM